VTHNALGSAGEKEMSEAVSRVFHFHQSQWLAPVNQPDQHYDNGNHEQDMDNPPYRVTAHQPQQPENY
jgi:hypothetical protein